MTNTTSCTRVLISENRRNPEVANYFERIHRLPYVEILDEGEGIRTSGFDQGKNEGVCTYVRFKDSKRLGPQPPQGVQRRGVINSFLEIGFSKPEGYPSNYRVFSNDHKNIKQFFDGLDMDKIQGLLARIVLNGGVKGSILNQKCLVNANFGLNIMPKDGYAHSDAWNLSLHRKSLGEILIPEDNTSIYCEFEDSLTRHESFFDQVRFA